MTKRHPLITPEELEHLNEIDRLLDEANAHMYSIGAYGKSSEGHLEVSFGTHQDRDPDEERYAPRVNIYAYMLGPHRGHHFDNTQQALDVVRVWHHNALLETEESEDDWDWDEEEQAPMPAPETGRDLKGIDLTLSHPRGVLPDPYLAIERERDARAQEQWERINQIMHDSDLDEGTSDE